MAIDAVAQVFIELQKIYQKLCDEGVKLLLTDAEVLFNDTGNLELLSPVFDNLGTDPDPLIETVINNQVAAFNTYMDELLLAAYLLNPDAQSDVEALKIGSKRIRLINSLLASANNFIDSPDKINNLLNEKIGEIKRVIDGEDIEDATEVNFEMPNLYNDQGTLIAATPDGRITISNPDNLESLLELEIFVNDYLTKISEVLDTTIKAEL